MRYTDAFRMRVIGEVYKDNSKSFAERGLEKACRTVARDIRMSAAVVKLWVSNYIRDQKHCLAKCMIQALEEGDAEISKFISDLIEDLAKEEK